MFGGQAAGSAVAALGGGLSGVQSVERVPQHYMQQQYTGGASGFGQEAGGGLPAGMQVRCLIVPAV